MKGVGLPGWRDHPPSPLLQKSPPSRDKIWVGMKMFSFHFILSFGSTGGSALAALGGENGEKGFMNISSGHLLKRPKKKTISPYFENSKMVAKCKYFLSMTNPRFPRKITYLEKMFLFRFRKKRETAAH